MLIHFFQTVWMSFRWCSFNFKCIRGRYSYIIILNWLQFFFRLHHDQQTAHALVAHESAAAYSSYPTMAGKFLIIILFYIFNYICLSSVCYTCNLWSRHIVNMIQLSIHPSNRRQSFLILFCFILTSFKKSTNSKILYLI